MKQRGRFEVSGSELMMNATYCRLLVTGDSLAYDAVKLDTQKAKMTA